MKPKTEDLLKRIEELEAEVARLKAAGGNHYHYHYGAAPAPVYTPQPVLPLWPQYPGPYWPPTWTVTCNGAGAAQIPLTALAQ